MRALKGTETGVALIACKHTVLTSDNACDQVAVAVGISHTLAVQDSLRRSREVIPHHIERSLQIADFIEGYRCAGVAFDAACALAHVKIAAELYRENIGRNKYVSYL